MHPAGGGLRVFKQFAWLEADSVKATLPRPAHRRVTQTVRPHENTMLTSGAQALILAGLLSAVAALAHVACIVIGAPMYRFMGAGERMAQAASAGKLQPTLLALAVASILSLWALYAFAGAGLIEPLPLMKLALPTISAVYLGRAIGFPLLKSAFPENSQTFWLVSSGICLVIGELHAYGTVLRWYEL